MKYILFPVIKIHKKYNFLFFLLFFFIDTILSYGFTQIINYFTFDFGAVESVANVPKWLLFVIMVIFAPLFETIVFQFVALELLLKLKISPSIAIVVSTVIFALFHNYNIPYMGYILLTGWILPYYYMALRDQGKSNKIVFVFMLHLIGNFISFFDYI
ncbi:MULTISPECIES: CPBP family intramembrane glutamic endopeptidase [Sphingobacterium]|nr:MULTISPECIES: CPBP family intramembrane glutamic endopeptidase [Sphingobacterium]QIH32279.1 CPBP family intramembrane metalloprotease [Sphingobacterium sp. DR205]